MSEHDETIANLVYDLHNALCRGDCDSFRAMVSAAIEAGIKLGEERGELKAARYERDWHDAKSEFTAALDRTREEAKAEGVREERELVLRGLHDMLREGIDAEWSHTLVANTAIRAAIHMVQARKP